MRAFIISLCIHISFALLLWFGFKNKYLSQDNSIAVTLNFDEVSRTVQLKSRAKKLLSPKTVSSLEENQFSQKSTQQNTLGDSTHDSHRSSGTTSQHSELLTAFISEVIYSLEQAKHYPRASMIREEVGKVTLKLKISHEGHLHSADIAEPCPFEALNQAALLTAKSINKYPRLPTEYPSEFIELLVPMQFTLQL